MMQIREATQTDSDSILRLLAELGHSAAAKGPLTVSYITEYLSFPYNTILLAEQDSHVTGLLAYSIRPDLYHGGDCCLIESFVVQASQRGQGVGSTLLAHLLEKLQAMNCAAVFVDVEPDNQRAIQFYRRHGLNNEVLLLERHL